MAAIVRRLRLVAEDDTPASAVGWGMQVSGGIRTVGRDRLLLSFSAGDGLGRYHIGLDPISGGFVDPDRQLLTRQSYGGYTAYRQHWNSRLRPNFMGGIANAAPGDLQPAGTFRCSYYAGGNLFVQIGEYINFGLEYVYGQRLNKDVPSKDNHRIQLGFQVF